MSKENLTIPLALVKDIIAKLDDEQLKELEGGSTAPASCTGGILSCFTSGASEEA
jgi:hypothetical protein